MGSRPRLRAVAPAGGADFISLELDFLLCAKDSFFEGQLNFHLEVTPTLGCFATRSARSPPAAKPKTKQLLEKIAEVRGVIRHATNVAQALLAEAVIAGALVGIREHAVGLVDLLEFLLSVVLFVDIRVELARKFTEGLLDLVLRGVPRYAEDFVIIAVAGHTLLLSVIHCDAREVGHAGRQSPGNCGLLFHFLTGGTRFIRRRPGFGAVLSVHRPANFLDHLPQIVVCLAHRVHIIQFGCLA